MLLIPGLGRQGGPAVRQQARAVSLHRCGLWVACGRRALSSRPLVSSRRLRSRRQALSSHPLLGSRQQ
jgi:hypothetical protein